MAEPVSFSAGSILSAISGAITVAVKVVEKVFEVRAVDEETTSLLETITAVTLNLKDAKILYRQKMHPLTKAERAMVERAFDGTEKALRSVAARVEPCRADVQIRGGKVGFSTRLLFILRDAPNVNVSMTQLQIANQSLSQALSTLYPRQTLPSHSNGEEVSNLAVNKRKAPPSYEESQLLMLSRNRNLRRRTNALQDQGQPENEAVPRNEVDEEIVTL